MKFVALCVILIVEMVIARSQVEEIAAQNGVVQPFGTLKPHFLEDESFVPRQCVGSICKCVTPQGTNLTEDFDIGLAYKTGCECVRDEYEYSLLGIVGKMFRCTSIGSYHPIQCSGSMCYCVNREGQQVGQQTANIGSQDQLNCPEL
ncbi:thyroglobulin-like [Argopecten irradians]|uniref:thyroglobulin-like n=1 Tax=Argopecten irradians TaxID=31199 RepID=UPI00371B79EB